MKKLLTATFCLSVLLMGANAAMAADTNTTYSKANTKVEKKAPPKFGQGQMQKPMMPNLEEELNLTEAQKQQARQNRIQGRKEMKPVMDEIRAKKEAIMDIFDSDLTDDKKQEQVKVIQKEIKELHKKANTIREKNMQNFEKILTKEQKTKFEEMKQKHLPKHECKKCGRMMPPPPPLEGE